MVCIQCGDTFEVPAEDDDGDEEDSEVEAMVCPSCGSGMTD